MEQKTSQLIERILKGIVIVGSFLIVLVPIVIVPKSYFPYIIQKTNILKILIELVVLAYLPLALWKADYRPKKSYLLWSVLAFAGVMILTTFTSQSIDRSWWGNWERSFGTFVYLHYFVWFIVLIGVFNKSKYWSRILNFSLLVSLLIGIYSVAQRLGVLGTFESGLIRVNGTMGNASFLASYMLMHMFIALLFLAEKISWKLRIWYLSIFVLDLAVLQLTATRGAQFGLFAAMILFIILVFALKVWERKTVKVLVLGSVLLFILVGTAIALKNATFIKGNYWLKRLTSYSLTDNTVQTRLHSWRWGLKGFRDYFIFGVGPENYQIVFNKYFEPDFYNYSSTEIWFDRAHNTLVDMASTMGIFGLLSYLVLLWAIFHALSQLYRHQKISKLSLIVLILLFFAYFVQNLAVFDSLNTLIIFFLLLAYIAYLYTSGRDNRNGSVFGVGEKLKINPIISLAVFGVLFLILFFNVDLRQIKENYYVYNAYIAGKYGKYKESMAAYYKTYAISINKIDPAILLSSTLSELAERNNENVTNERFMSDVEKAIVWMNKAIDLDPQNMFLYYLQAKNYALATQLSRDVKYLEKGIKMAEKAQELSPGRVRPLWILGQLYLYGNQPQQAIEYLEKARSLNDNQSETYFYLSVVYQSLGDQEKYYEQIDKLVDKSFGFFSPDTIKKAIVHYDEKKDTKRLIYLYFELTRLESKDLNHWRNFIDLLVSDRQYDLALGALQKAADAIPAFSSRAYAQYQDILKLKESENKK